MCPIAVNYGYISKDAIPMCYTFTKYGELKSIKIIDKKFFIAIFSADKEMTSVVYNDNAVWKNSAIPPLPVPTNPNIQITKSISYYLDVYNQVDFRNLYEKTKKEEDAECEYANFRVAYEDNNTMLIGNYEMIRYEGGEL